jgi:hypothetical protein
MNWENSKALTPLKRDFLKSFFAETQNFFLTLGSALGIFYLQHRRSYDLDFFSTEPASIDWHLLTNQLLGISNKIGAALRTISATPDFHRFELTREGEREILDFVAEHVPQLDSGKVTFGPIRVDTLREIIANKLCTLVGRAEQKDLIDLYFLEQRGHTVLAHLADAQLKEGGIDPAVLSFLLSEITIKAIPEYVLEPLTPSDLETFVRKLQKDLAALSFPS